MRANIVSVSVILREKVQFMYNFNRFVAFIPLFSHNKNFESSSQVEMQNRLCSSHTVNCFQNQFPLTYFRFRYIDLHNVSFSFSWLYPEIIIQSLYALYRLVNVENVKQFRQTTKI